MEKALVIKGPLADLSDVLRVARTQGKIVLNRKKVKVKPLVYPYGIDGYLVVVEPDGSGCSKVSDVGNRAKRNRK